VTRPAIVSAVRLSRRTRVVIESGDLSRQPKGFAMFGRIGIPELVIILFIIILIFGANRLPEIGRGIGKGIRNFKESTREGQNEASESSRPKA
jgi:sec-independent protein translocase protein TatA